ncbi:MAG TPA: hypothetical protein VH352_24855 [Pseudonocardiaceae bacterium]|nr:hypothetical protein [Pseudonocardiaceae bacterium]
MAPCRYRRRAGPISAYRASASNACAKRYPPSAPSTSTVSASSASNAVATAATGSDVTCASNGIWSRWRPPNTDNARATASSSGAVGATRRSRASRLVSRMRSAGAANRATPSVMATKPCSTNDLAISAAKNGLPSARRPISWDSSSSAADPRVRATTALIALSDNGRNSTWTTSVCDSWSEPGRRVATTPIGASDRRRSDAASNASESSSSRSTSSIASSSGPSAHRAVNSLVSASHARPIQLPDSAVASRTSKAATASWRQRSA